MQAGGGYSVQTAMFFSRIGPHVGSSTDGVAIWCVTSGKIDVAPCVMISVVLDLPSTLPLPAGFVALPPQRLFDATGLEAWLLMIVLVVDGGCDILLGVTDPIVSYCTVAGCAAVLCGPRGQWHKGREPKAWVG